MFSKSLLFLLAAVLLLTTSFASLIADPSDYAAAVIDNEIDATMIHGIPKAVTDDVDALAFAALETLLSSETTPKEKRSSKCSLTNVAVRREWLVIPYPRGVEIC